MRCIPDFSSFSHTLFNNDSSFGYRLFCNALVESRIMLHWFFSFSFFLHGVIRSSAASGMRHLIGIFTAYDLLVSQIYHLLISFLLEPCNQTGVEQYLILRLLQPDETLYILFPRNLLLHIPLPNNGIVPFSTILPEPPMFGSQACLYVLFCTFTVALFQTMRVPLHFIVCLFCLSRLHLLLE